MALSFPQGFSMAHNEPVDNRFVLSKAEMLTIKKAKMPDVYFTICSDDGNLYLYNKDNELNDETGRFKKMETSVLSNILNGGNVGEESDSNVTFSFKKGSTEDWTNTNPILEVGEPGFEEDTGMMKIGDGETPWEDLPYLQTFSEQPTISTEQIQSLFN